MFQFFCTPCSREKLIFTQVQYWISLYVVFRGTVYCFCNLYPSCVVLFCASAPVKLLCYKNWFALLFSAVDTTGVLQARHWGPAAAGRPTSRSASIGVNVCGRWRPRIWTNAGVGTESRAVLGRRCPGTYTSVAWRLPGTRVVRRHRCNMCIDICVLLSFPWQSWSISLHCFVKRACVRMFVTNVTLA